MNNQKFYFITVMEKLCDNNGWCQTGATRCWGFYLNRQDAINALHNNITDMWEYCYDYAVIEEYEAGISGYNFNRQFFKWNNDREGYFEIDEPECVKHICSFAIG